MSHDMRQKIPNNRKISSRYWPRPTKILAPEIKRISEPVDISYKEFHDTILTVEVERSQKENCYGWEEKHPLFQPLGKQISTSPAIPEGWMMLDDALETVGHMVSEHSFGDVSVWQEEDDHCLKRLRLETPANNVVGMVHQWHLSTFCITSSPTSASPYIRVPSV